MAEDDDGEAENDDIPLQELADAVAKRRNGSIHQDANPEPGPSDPKTKASGASTSGFDAPLQKLANAIANRRAAKERDGQPSYPVADQQDDTSTEVDSVEQVQRVPTLVAVTESSLVNQLASGAQMDTSPFMFTVHYAVTAAAFLSSAAIYLGAGAELIPPQYWTLAMPPLVIGVIGALPILSRWAGIWKPEELR